LISSPAPSFNAWPSSPNPKERAVNSLSVTSLSYTFFFFLRKLHSLKSVFYGFKWASKIPVITDSYKRCMSRLELETCCANLKFFVITLRFLGTPSYTLHTPHSLPCTYIVNHYHG
jgi:hypothetical protein